MAGHVLHRAEPGENTQDTELYNPFTTPTSSFIEWGIGVDLYFSSLRALAFVLLIAGIINIPALMYYSGNEYTDDGQAAVNTFSLVGSAICTSAEWVVCEDCRPDQFSEDENEKKRFAIDLETNTTLVQKNLCEGVVTQTVITHWVSLFFVTGVVIFLSLYWSAREVRFDEDK